MSQGISIEGLIPCNRCILAFFVVFYPSNMINPAAELCADEEPQSQLVKEFNEKVRPHLSDEQMDFIYERYGNCKTLDEIAEGLPPGEDGEPISRC